MAEIVDSYKPKWISNKDNFIFDENTSKIFNFYVICSPCENTSSSGVSLEERGWKKESLYGYEQLKKYLYDSARLENGVNYSVARKKENMSDRQKAIGLDNRFYKEIVCNKILFYNSSSRKDLLQLLYYIRCSMAHGCFEIVYSGTGRYYIMESIKKEREKNIVKAQMVISEDTLLEWIDIIKEGPKGLADRIVKTEKEYSQMLLQIIKENPCISRQKICQNIPLKIADAQRLFTKLRDTNVIKYNNSLRIWEICK